jgi:hypothetical protein
MFWGFGVSVGCLVCSQGFGLKLGALIAGFLKKVNNYFLLFLGVTRIAQSLARYGAIGAAPPCESPLIFTAEDAAIAEADGWQN